MAKSLEQKRQVKLALAAKYARLADLAGSVPKQKTFLFHSRRFRNQAAAIAQKIAERQGSARS
jgi:hypothetical protein|uniref:Uncharacterized protein n=1 Tax=Schlesneria paludicola TaxID=360056 RepID=A0A7C4QMP2_9PLAN